MTRQEYKNNPRSEEEIRKLTNRIHRMVGQLNGIEKMIEDNRYCGDVLIQIAAIEKALQAFGYIILEDHLDSCVLEEAKNENEEIVKEIMSFIKNLK